VSGINQFAGDEAGYKSVSLSIWRIVIDKHITRMPSSSSEAQRDLTMVCDRADEAEVNSGM